MHASHDSRETFARVSHDVRENLNQFFFLAIKSRNGLIMSQSFRICIAHLSHCEIAETKLRCVCEGLATGSRRIRGTCDDLAIVLR